MNIEKYSERVRGFLQSAQTNALSQGNQQFTPEHVLKVLLDDDQGMAASLIERAGGDAKAARLANDAALAKLPKVSGGDGQVYLSQPLAKVFTTAEEASKKAGDSFVTVERLLQALAIEIVCVDLGHAEEGWRHAGRAQPGHQRYPQGPHRQFRQRGAGLRFPEEVCPRSHRRGPRGQARSGDRT